MDLDLTFDALEKQILDLDICKSCRFWTFAKKETEIKNNQLEQSYTETVHFIGKCSKRDAETGSFNKACEFFERKMGEKD